MKKSMLNKLLLALIVSFSVAVACENGEVELSEEPYLELHPESCDGLADGQGDGVILSIRSNVSWTVSAIGADNNPVDWMVFESTSGIGDADILCFILRGKLEEERTCKIVVCSEDGGFRKELDIYQGKYVPASTYITLREILRDAYAQEIGAPGVLPEYTKADLEVIGIPGDNLPEGYVYLTEGGIAWARLKVSATLSVEVGDVLQLDFTGGTVTKEANGSYTLDLRKEPVVLTSDAPAVSPKYISSDAMPAYENMLVELRNVQAPETLAGTQWKGDVTLYATDEEDAVFPVHMEEGVSFGNIGPGSGVVRGIIINGKLCPRSADDLAGLTGVRIPPYRMPYQIVPVINVIKCGDVDNALANGAVTGKTKLTFTDEPGYSVAGASIEKIGGDKANAMKIAATSVSAPFNSCFTTVSWHLEDTYLLYTIPVTQKIYGDLEFAFSMSCKKQGVFSDFWTVSWSSDGTDYKPVDAVYCANAYTSANAEGSTYRLTKTNVQNNRQVAEFTIPEIEALTSGNIFIKLQHPVIDEASKSLTLRMNSGSVLSSRVRNMPKRAYDNVLAMENFESCLYGHNPVIGAPTYYFTTINVLEPATTFTSTEGWMVTGNSLACRGCLRLSSDSDENYICSPPLEMLEVPTDIKVTFKVAPFVDASAADLVVHEDNVVVKVNGTGTVGDIVWDREYDPYCWRTGVVSVLGASSDTRILIGNVNGEPSSQCYVDEITISR